jgi:hypothetical protein
MKLPEKRDPRAALAKAQLQLTQAEGKLSELTMARGQALIDTDDVASVAAIDLQLTDQHRVINVLADHVAAWHRQVRQLDHEQLEAERTAAIDELQKGFDRRLKLAHEVEAAVNHFGELWDRLLNSREDALKAWPEQFFARPPAETLQSMSIVRELQWLLYASGKPTGLRACSIPAPSNAGLGIQGISPKGIAGAVAAEQEALIEILKNKPLPVVDGEEAAA